VKTVRIFDIDIPEHIFIPLFSAVFMVVWVLIGFSIKAFLFARLRTLAAKTKTNLDDLLISALNVPLILLIISAGFMTLAGFVNLSLTPSDRYFIFLAVTVMAAIIFVDRMLRGTIDLFADRIEIFKTAGGLIQTSVRGAVVVLGTLVLLGTLGVNVTPILASLGVSSLAVALALQPTLENFFAGVQIVTDRPILPGHFIRLESGEEGYVEKITWRSTWLRTLQGNMVVLPNKHLVTSRVLNYYYPDKEHSFPVQLSVHYSSDLEQVERVALDVARELQRSFPGAVKTFEPVVRFFGLGASGIELRVVLRIEEYTLQGPVQHAFIKALIARFRSEKISIPFPIMALNLSQEGAEAALKRPA